MFLKRYIKQGAGMGKVDDLERQGAEVVRNDRGLTRRDFCKFGIAACVVGPMMGPALVGAAEKADSVILNGKIYTMNPEQPWAEAIAFSGTDIVYVGDNKGAKKYISSNTLVGDLKGKMAMPGLVSSHEHPFLTMGLASGLMLEYTGDATKMLASLKEYIANKPDGAAFSFGGSYEGIVTITREDIDAIVSDKPFLMIVASGHGGWCNTKALEVAGLTKDTPDPVPSFGRESDGTPTGVINSSGAIAWMSDVLDVFPSEGLEGLALEVLKGFVGYGITAVFDAGAPNMEEAMYKTISNLEKSGTLPMRISASVMTQRESMNKGVMEMLDKYSKEFHSDLFKVDTFKVHGDGSFDGHTAGTLDPYTDKPDSRGKKSFTADVQRDMTLAAVAKGYDVHTHAIGDGTARQTLDVYEAVRDKGFKDVRLTVAHTCLVHPDDKPRFKELDIIVNTFATANAVPSETMLARLGPERYYEWIFQPMRSFLKQGVKVVMSADMPTADLNPFMQMSVAMNRRAPNTKESLPPAAEALTLEEVLRAYTIDSAYMLRWEDSIGSLEVGKKADMIVLDKNLFDLTSDEISEVKVLSTTMNGKIVYEEDVDWDPSEDLMSDVDLIP
ncbi:MAG: amidohydrolase [Desulfovibrio sp.]